MRQKYGCGKKSYKFSVPKNWLFLNGGDRKSQAYKPENQERGQDMKPYTDQVITKYAGLMDLIIKREGQKTDKTGWPIFEEAG